MGLLRRSSQPMDEQTGISDLDNPLAGTPFDPARRAWLRGQAPPDAMSADVNGGGGGSGPDTSEGTAAMPQGQGGQGQEQSASAPMSAPVQSAPRTGAQGTQTQPGDMDENALFSRIMNTTMNDTPSNDRINKLQGEYDANNQKPGLKSRLLTLAAMAAPVVVGGIAGGVEGAGSAAGGVLDAENTLHERHMEDNAVIRSQMDSERNRQERQFERRQQLPVTMMNMKMIRDYRNATLATNNKKIDLQHGDALAKLGLDSNGNPLPEDQLPVAQKARVMQMRAHADLYDSQQQLADARAELAKAQNDPSSPAYTLAKGKVDAALAQAQAASSRANAMGLSSLVREAQYYKSAFGSDMDGATLPGTFADPDGNPMGWNAPGNPTSNVKQRGQTAATVLQHFHTNPQNPSDEGLMDLIQKTPDASLGGLAGHFNEWYLGKYGAKDPALSKLRTKLMLASTAMMLSHVGQSGGIDMMNHFKSMLNLGQDKQNLLANVAETENWMKGYRDAGEPNTPVGEVNPNFKPVNSGGKTGAGRLQRPGSGSGGSNASSQDSGNSSRGNGGAGSGRQLDKHNEADIAIAQGYIAKAGGDKVKARKLAAADGVKF